MTVNAARLLAREFGRTADVGVAEVVEHGLLVVGHAFGEIRIVETLIARRLRHILEHSQFLLHDLLALPRHLLPLRQNVVFDVLLLLRRELPPGIFVLAETRLLLWRQVIPLTELLADLVLFFRRKVLKGFAILQNAIPLSRGEIAHLVHPGTRRTNSRLLPPRQARFAPISWGALVVEIRVRRCIRSRWTISRIVRARRRMVRVCASGVRVHRRPVCIRMLGMRLRRRRLGLALRWPVGMRILRPTESGQSNTVCQGEKCGTELEFVVHSLLCFFASVASLPYICC